MPDDDRERLREWIAHGDIDATMALVIRGSRAGDVGLLVETIDLLSEPAEHDLAGALASWQEKHDARYDPGWSVKMRLADALQTVKPLTRVVHELPADAFTTLVAYVALDCPAIRDDQRREIAARALGPAGTKRFDRASRELTPLLANVERWYQGSARGFLEGQPAEIKVRSTLMERDALIAAVGLAVEADDESLGILARVLCEAFLHPGALVRADPEVLAGRRRRGHREYRETQTDHIMMSVDSAILTSALDAFARHPGLAHDVSVCAALESLLSVAQPWPTVDHVIGILGSQLDHFPPSVRAIVLRHGARCTDGAYTTARKPLAWLLAQTKSRFSASERHDFLRYVEADQWGVRDLLIEWTRGHLRGEHHALIEVELPTLLDRYLAGSTLHRVFAANLWSGRTNNPWPDLEPFYRRVVGDSDETVQMVLRGDGDSILRDLAFDEFY